ncbi:hypothetical protein CFIO01_02129 [Colletotrichum fioriniae PJ7]|uniref:Fungal STAND N-terminal Goodbye domain-containing protein n=1 Tax=Colletotrichum fioriniae PJ7 TaxID=1445577 RepID=A0A010RWI9_9PEZI|nr:hypothetical protein CFIO01_02129 [Colletotrichum fioriniae PJ7]
MTDYVGTFIKTRAGEIDPGWRESARDRFIERKRLEQASVEAHLQTKSFRSLIHKFKTRTKCKELAAFDIEKDFKWEHVRIMALQAIEREDAKTEMSNGWLPAAGRTFQRNASNLEILVKLLPSGDFTGILCGALTLIFCAAKHIDEVRSKIISCLASLPGIMEETEEYVQIYHDDPKVLRAAEDLYLGILDGVESMLRWIDKGFKALMKPSTSGNSVTEVAIKEKIEGNVDRFRDVVQRSLHRNVNKPRKALTEQLKGDLKQSNWVQETPQAAQMLRTSFATLDQIRASINCDPQIPQRDMVTAMVDTDKVCSPEAIEDARLALRDRRFTFWLQSSSSQILLINGRMKLTPEQEAASPLTMISCTLAQAVSRESGRSLPLVYLCGQHNSPNDPYSGVNGVLRCWSSVIAESLSPLDVDLSAINLSFVDGIRAQQLEALCMLFQLLLVSARGKVVFVILDGVSWLEVSRHVQGLGLVITFLRNLVASLNQQQSPRNPDAVIVKVLITDPTTSDYTRQLLPKNCILEMDDVR